MKKIILVANNYWNIKNFRFKLCKELDKKYDLTLSAELDSYRDYLTELGFKCDDSPIKRGWVGLNKEILGICKLIIKLLKRHELYILYTVKIAFYYGLILRFIHRKYVIVITGFGSHFKKKSGIAFKIFTFICCGAEKVIVQNEDDYDLLSQYNVNIIQINGSGVEVPEHILGPKKDGDGIVFLMIGRIIKDKGVIEYLTCANNIINKYQNVSFKLIGSFDNVNPTSLKLVDIKNFLNDKISYIDFKDDINDEIQSADVIVLPSYTEGLSKALLEGAAYGKPLVATNIAGCRAICVDGHNGYICECRDIEGLERNIEKLILMGAQKRYDFGMNSRKLVEDFFEVSKINNKYLNVIEGVINES